MRVLWICNVLIPLIAGEIGQPLSVGGGWLQGLAEDLREDVELRLCFPQKPGAAPLEGKAAGVGYSGFPQGKHSKENYRQTKGRFLEILREFRPQVIHIFGTEFWHSACALDACRELGLEERVVASIQGMPSVYAKHVRGGIPGRVYYGLSLRDILKWDNEYLNARDLKKRGETERKMLSRCPNAIGRTDWDRACVEQINGDCRYFFCNETLRGEFYRHTWSLDTCRRHSLFVSQCHKPIKGYHRMLEALAILVKKYPDAVLYTTGRDVLKARGMDYHRMTRYQQYLAREIRRLGLQDHVVFCGSLSEEQMCRQYLSTHVFVSPSAIENSPNSLGEAMLLGVPSVASDVGGVKNLMEHGAEGFVYPFDEPYMIAHYVDRIFRDDDLARSLSENAREKAGRTHHRQTNKKRILEIYHELDKG